MIDWQVLANESTLSTAAMAEMADRWDKRELTSFRQEVRFFEFEDNGKPFTQVAVVLTPDRPLVVDGRRVVFVASEGGHDNGREFFSDDLCREGAGPWLAKRGVTFIALCRLGRWNFMANEAFGSWRDVPLERRMPIFHRGQNTYWRESEYDVVPAGEVSSETGSEFCRVPKSGSDLESHMMALTPTTVISGFRNALSGCPEIADRSDVLLLYWGFSTGGAFLWPLAKQVVPDGIAGFGMSNFPVALYATRAAKGNHKNLYEKSGLRLRERGRKDFSFFSSGLSDAERERQWQEALRSPRFKSYEDTFMFFNIAALSEWIARLWFAGDLPDDVRNAGFGELLKRNIDLLFPDEALSSVRVLNLTGTNDEIQSAAVVRGISAVVRPYCRTYKSLFLEGLHHSISAEQARLFGSVWLDAIKSRYFSPH
ncbi:MAG: hypothetical protein QOF09_4670 [Alphaproteobacteria bacterium]|jgi:hypothetical protein|nr:hypothetical protein [Alphaproteobacteria bacterium]